MLSPAERHALYSLPDFNDFQRAEFFTFTAKELALAECRKKPHARLYCLLQIGYFKAKNIFFDLSGQAVSSKDIAFLIERYFYDNPLELHPLTKYEQYTQRIEMAQFPKSMRR